DGREGDGGSHPENDFIRQCRNNIFFGQDLDHIGHGLQKAERPDPVGPQPDLETGDDAALHPYEYDDAGHQEADEQHCQDYQVPPEIAGPVGGNAPGVNHRSTSPMERSMLPKIMMAS